MDEEFDLHCNDDGVLGPINRGLESWDFWHWCNHNDFVSLLAGIDANGASIAKEF